MATTSPAAKLRSHIERAEQMADCIPFWLWMADDGTPEGWIFWAEQWDGLRSLVNFVAAEQRSN